MSLDISLLQPHLSCPSNNAETVAAHTKKELIAKIGDPSLPCSTYHLIRHAFEKYSDKVIDYTLSKMGENPSDYKALQFHTSCVITGFALTLLLLGEQTAIKFNERLNLSHHTMHAIHLEEINHCVFNLRNIFNGALITKINASEYFDSLNKKQQSTFIEGTLNDLGRKFTAQIQKQFNSNETAIKTRSLEKILMNTDYNAPVFESLKQEFVKNENQISEKESCLYTICIREGGMDGCSPALHFILIEQFLFNGEIRYRLYHSFIEEATLLQSFKRCQYGKNEEGTWNKKQLDTFLNAFQNCFVPGISNIERAERTKECFGFEFARQPVWSLLDKSTYTGLTLRFYSQKFDKAKAYQNLAAIISSSNP